MKFSAYTLLVAAAAAAEHDACTMTWEGASDPACAGEGERCFDWRNEAGDTSLGLMCGLATNCGKQFEWAAEGKDPVKYTGVCEGLSMASCGDNKDQCDTAGKFVCADWTAKDGKTTVGCASKDNECGQTVNAYDIACTGLDGETCTGGDACDKNAGLKCAMEFNNQTLKWTAGTNKCTAGDKCGTAKDNSTVYLCYDQHLNGCNATTTCVKPEGDNGEVTCGYFAVGGANLTSGGMCIDDTDCNKDNATQGKNTTYYGVDALLICGSVKTGLALGAAVVSAYLAM